MPCQAGEPVDDDDHLLGRLQRIQEPHEIPGSVQPERAIVQIFADLVGQALQDRSAIRAFHSEEQAGLILAELPQQRGLPDTAATVYGARLRSFPGIDVFESPQLRASADQFHAW